MKIYLLFLLIIMSCKNKTENLKLSDENRAIQIAAKKWNEVYGDKTMNEEQPLKAKKENDSIWFVEGTFKGNGRGGVAFGKVDVKNKKVIEYSHGK